MMGRVAIETSDIAAGVGRLREMRLLVSFAMAAKTTRACFLPRLSFEHEYLGLVAAAGHMVGSRSMATLTTSL
jgi:hypothetical protein